jgi:hypothetical protein
MAEHRFRVGEQVRMAARYPDPASNTLYEIVRLMPETPNGEFHYRVRNPGGQERAAAESQLSAAEDAAMAAGS